MTESTVAAGWLSGWEKPPVVIPRSYKAINNNDRKLAHSYDGARLTDCRSSFAGRAGVLDEALKLKQYRGIVFLSFRNMWLFSAARLCSADTNVGWWLVTQC